MAQRGMASCPAISAIFSRALDSAKKIAALNKAYDSSFIAVRNPDSAVKGSFAYLPIHPDPRTPDETEHLRSTIAAIMPGG